MPLLSQVDSSLDPRVETKWILTLQSTKVSQGSKNRSSYLICNWKSKRKEMEIFQWSLEERSLRDKNQDIKEGLMLGPWYLWSCRRICVDANFGGNPAWLVLDSLSSHMKAGSVFVWRTGNWIPLLLLQQTPALGQRITGKRILIETGSRQEANL